MAGLGVHKVGICSKYSGVFHVERWRVGWMNRRAFLGWLGKLGTVLAGLSWLWRWLAPLYPALGEVAWRAKYGTVVLDKERVVKMHVGRIYGCTVLRSQDITNMQWQDPALWDEL